MCNLKPLFIKDIFTHLHCILIKLCSMVKGSHVQCTCTLQNNIHCIIQTTMETWDTLLYSR